MRLVLALALLGPPTPTATEATCSTDDTLAPSGSNLWVGLTGKRIRLTLNDGRELDGRVAGQSSEHLAIARASDEHLVAIDKLDIADVDVREPSLAGPARRVGRHQRAAGGVLLILGSIAASTGTVWLAMCPQCLYLNLPLVLPGALMVGSGAGLLTVGERKRRQYERSWGLARARLTPSLALGREGGHVGLTLRF